MNTNKHESEKTISVNSCLFVVEKKIWNRNQSPPFVLIPLVPAKELMEPRMNTNKHESEKTISVDSCLFVVENRRLSHLSGHRPDPLPDSPRQNRLHEVLGQLPAQINGPLPASDPLGIPPEKPVEIGPVGDRPAGEPA